MTIHIRTRKEQKMQLNGNLLTGDTFPVKHYIASKLNGQWDKERKGWLVDTTLVEKWLDKGGTIYTDKDVKVTSKPVAWTYAHFLSSQNDPNSDY